MTILLVFMWDPAPLLQLMWALLIFKWNKSWTRKRYWANILWLTHTAAHVFFFYFLANLAMQLFLFLDGRLDFCRIGQIYHQSYSKKLKRRKYIPFSFAWLTHILSTAWPKANRKIRIPAKIHITWFFSLSGLLSAKNMQIYGKAESMFNMT